jgi:hypothetical protein
MLVWVAYLMRLEQPGSQTGLQALVDADAGIEEKSNSWKLEVSLTDRKSGDFSNAGWNHKSIKSSLRSGEDKSKVCRSKTKGGQKKLEHRTAAE